MQEYQRERSNGIVARLSRAGLSLQEDAVRKAILKAFADEGHAPSVQALAHVLGLSLAPVLAVCRTLAASDLIVWQDDTTQIVSAYPFSGSQTTHQVLLGGHTTRYAMCAIDALGIPFMLEQGVHIRSTCFFCHTLVTVDIDGGLLQSASPSTLRVWLSERDGCCVAEVRCPLMNFFCDEAHLQAWLQQGGSPREVAPGIQAENDVEGGRRQGDSVYVAAAKLHQVIEACLTRAGLGLCMAHGGNIDPQYMTAQELRQIARRATRPTPHIEHPRPCRDPGLPGKGRNPLWRQRTLLADRGLAVGEGRRRERALAQRIVEAGNLGTLEHGLLHVHICAPDRSEPTVSTLRFGGPSARGERPRHPEDVASRHDRRPALQYTGLLL
jgi:hypothetical protein